MTHNGFRGANLPAMPRVVTARADPRKSSAAPKAVPTRDGILAEYLAVNGVGDPNLWLVQHDGRAEGDLAVGDLFELFDLVTLRTTSGREPSTLPKELLPGIHLSATRVQETVGDFGIQAAVDQLLDGMPTLGPRPLLAPAEEESSPMMWLMSAGDPGLGEALYRSVDEIYRPHRHMWSHHERDSDVLRWAILYQLCDEELDEILPGLRDQPAYKVFDDRANRALERMKAQSGAPTPR